MWTARSAPFAMNAPPSAGPADEPAPAKAGGYRDRDFDTRLGTLNLRIPKLRQGGYFPPFLEKPQNQ